MLEDADDGNGYHQDILILPNDVHAQQRVESQGARPKADELTLEKLAVANDLNMPLSISKKSPQEDAARTSCASGVEEALSTPASRADLGDDPAQDPNSVKILLKSASKAQRAG